MKSFKKKLLVGALSAMVCCSFAYEAEAADSAEGNFCPNPSAVGKEIAKKISDAGLVFEEYVK